MKVGDKVWSKEDGSIWTVCYSSFGFSLHRVSEGKLMKTLGMSKEEIQKEFELIK